MSTNTEQTLPDLDWSYVELNEPGWTHVGHAKGARTTTIASGRTTYLSAGAGFEDWVTLVPTGDRYAYGPGILNPGFDPLRAISGGFWWRPAGWSDALEVGPLEVSAGLDVHSVTIRVGGEGWRVSAPAGLAASHARSSDGDQISIWESYREEHLSEVGFPDLADLPAHARSIVLAFLDAKAGHTLGATVMAELTGSTVHGGVNGEYAWLQVTGQDDHARMMDLQQLQQVADLVGSLLAAARRTFEAESLASLEAID